MKRSEMIEHMAAELKEYIELLKTKSPNYPMENWLINKADSLLSMQEGFGMLPPSINSPDEPSLMFSNAWEKE